MAYIKKLVMKGFKSFARETIVEMDRHMNVIVGPNGSGKSNITDALCFVLGRLSIKSIRAAKASHLIFSGNKHYKGANLAYVEIVFDNSDKTFALDEKEIIIRRTVKKNGQSVYKINNHVKTRQEILELLSQAGIDPHGFNIVLQGEIERFVKMQPEERRKVLEEVAGISIYEMRKDKSLKELERTNEKLRQIGGVLRERGRYLNNLEKEREEALRFKKLQLTEKRCQASIINRNLQDKQKQVTEIIKELSVREKEIEQKSRQIEKFHEEIHKLEAKIDEISNTIRKESGFQRDSLNNEISSLKQEIAAMDVRKENLSGKLIEFERRKKALQEDIKAMQAEIKTMREEKGKYKKSELEKKKARLAELEQAKTQYYNLKSQLSSVTYQIEEKKKQKLNLNNDSSRIIKEIERIESELKIKDNLEKCREKIMQLKHSLETNKKKILELEQEIKKEERIPAAQNQIIQSSEIIKSKVAKLDICPLCKTKITKEHILEVKNKADSDIKDAKDVIEKSEHNIRQLEKQLTALRTENYKQEGEMHLREITIVKLQAIEDKKQQIKRNNSQLNDSDKELKSLEAKKQNLENKLAATKTNDDQYERLKVEVNDLQRIDDKDVGREILLKEREVENAQIAIKQITRDTTEAVEHLEDIKEKLEEKGELVEEKEKQEEILRKKYEKMYENQKQLQDRARRINSDLAQQENQKSVLESNANNLKIKRAHVVAQKDTFLEDLKEFEGIKFLPGNVDELREKLHKTQMALDRIGSVNMRSLEVYDNIKSEYDKIRDKVEQLEKEKQEILKVMAQIDRKKKKTFLQTLNAINELFSNNFANLSTKGTVTLEPQDKKDVFEHGLDIRVRVGGGKQFDVTSLSGGEQTLVSLSLIFAIQDYRPYCFYIFDEIDAALDRRNSEKLAYLLKKHMKHGQYLIITHNDSIISESSNILYGVSMQEGISKILSLEL
jgi:chromosome segregation protein